MWYLSGSNRPFSSNCHRTVWNWLKRDYLKSLYPHKNTSNVFSNKKYVFVVSQKSPILFLHSTFNAILIKISKRRSIWKKIFSCVVVCSKNNVRPASSGTKWAVLWFIFHPIIEIEVFTFSIILLIFMVQSVPHSRIQKLRNTNWDTSYPQHFTRHDWWVLVARWTLHTGPKSYTFRGPTPVRCAPMRVPSSAFSLISRKNGAYVIRFCVDESVNQSAHILLYRSPTNLIFFYTYVNLWFHPH